MLLFMGSTESKNGTGIYHNRFRVQSTYVGWLLIACGFLVARRPSELGSGETEGMG